MATDPFGGPFRTDCACSPDAGSPNFETAVCGLPSPVCSDGDPDRQLGGYGLALRSELNLGAGSTSLPVPGAGRERQRSAVDLAALSDREPADAGSSRSATRAASGAAPPGRSITVRTTEALEQTVARSALQVDRAAAASVTRSGPTGPSRRSPITGTFNTHSTLLEVRSSDWAGTPARRSTRPRRRPTAATRTTAACSRATRSASPGSAISRRSEHAANPTLPADLQEGLRPHHGGDRGDPRGRRARPQRRACSSRCRAARVARRERATASA